MAVGSVNTGTARSIVANGKPAAAPPDELLIARAVRFTYPGAGASEPVLSGFDLSVRRGEFFCLVGPSGCGKTSILNLLAGFTRPDEGTITLGGKLVDKPDADRGVVFQGDDALFSWLTALQNVQFGLKMKGIDAARQREIADQFLDIVHLSAHAHKYPGELSGGMKQRVQIARVLANDPQILLMDEPFGAVDAQTRASLQDELAEIWQKTAKTVVFITHDITESVLLADRIGILSKGPGSHLLRVVENDLPRPRRRSNHRFGEIWEEINALLH